LDNQIHDLKLLQQVDSDIKTEEDAIAAVPGAIAAIDARAQEMETELAKSREGLEEAQKERRKLEGELELVKARFSKYQDQLMDVKTNEAYRVMLREIDAAKAKVAAHEERILENMLQADELEAQCKGGEKEFEVTRGRLEEEKKDLERRSKEAEDRRGGLESERRQIRERIAAEALKTYDRVATMRGVAVCGAREELCLGCRVKVRPQVFQEILHGELRQCDSCTRFLFVSEEPDEASLPGAADASPPGAPPSDEPTS